MFSLFLLISQVMKTHGYLRSIALGIITLTSSAYAEMYKFTNTEGQSIEAEITAVASGKVKLKMANGKSYNLPISSLIEADKTYIKDWYEKNKNNAKPSHFKLDLDKKSERVREPRDKDKDSKKGASSKTSKRDYTYHFKLAYNKSTPVENISVNYQMIKRTSTRGDNAGDPVYELTSGTETIPSLDSKTPKEWTSDTVHCEDISTKSKTGSSSQKETILGILVTVSVDGKELFTECEPRDFAKELAELQEEHPDLVPEEPKKAPKKKKKK